MTTEDRARIQAEIRAELPHQMDRLSALLMVRSGKAHNDVIDALARDLADAVVLVMEGKADARV